jgi:hypothetical protein
MIIQERATCSKETAAVTEELPLPCSFRAAVDFENVRVFRDRKAHRTWSAGNACRALV